MDLLRSSLLGKEFINYRKHTSENDRRRFQRLSEISDKIPIIIDSVDEEISQMFRKKTFINDSRIIKYGIELQMDKKSYMKDVLKEIKIEMVKADKESMFKENNLKMGLEDGSIITNEELKVIDVYRKHRNYNDNILYILVTKEQTMYSYIMSILKSLLNIFYGEKL